MWAAYIKKELPDRSLGKKGQLRMLHGMDLVKLNQAPEFFRNSFMIIDDMDNFIAPFRYNIRDQFKRLYFSRGGAIGDIVALSSPIVAMMKKGFDVTLVTDKDAYCIADWFELVPKLKNYNQPFIEKYKQGSDAIKATGHIDILGKIESGVHKNWYEILWESMEWPFSPAMGRPALRTTRLPGPSNLGKDDLLFVISATDSRRTIPIWTAYEAAINANLHKKYRLCVHDFNFDPHERVWYDFNKPDIHLLPRSSRKQALLDFYDAGMVIASDTGCFHFREGVKKPAIGLYNSFTTDSRTKYYLYTRSYDVKGWNCPKHPCFEHGSINGRYCTENPDKLFYSPCVNNIVEILTEIFESI